MPISRGTARAFDAGSRALTLATRSSVPVPIVARMLNPGYRYRSLGELTDEELISMFDDDESLFVEHKQDSGGEGFPNRPS